MAPTVLGAAADDSRAGSAWAGIPGISVFITRWLTCHVSREGRRVCEARVSRRHELVSEGRQQGRMSELALCAKALPSDAMHLHEA